MEKERWLSMNEICAHLGISRDTALKWINKKNMPAHKIEKFGDLVFLKLMSGSKIMGK